MWTGGLAGTATGYPSSMRLTRRSLSSPLRTCSRWACGHTMQSAARFHALLQGVRGEEFMSREYALFLICLLKLMAI